MSPDATDYASAIAETDTGLPSRSVSSPVFGDGSDVADPQIAYVLDRRQSILDGVLGDLSSLRTKLSSEDQTRMDAYASGIRDLEDQIAASRLANTCIGDGAMDSDPEQYLRDMRTMQHIIVRAFECDAARSATLMYHEGIGDSSITSSTPRQAALLRPQRLGRADLYVDLFGLYGINRASFGEGSWASTGTPSGILSG